MNKEQKKARRKDIRTANQLRAIEKKKRVQEELEELEKGPEDVPEEIETSEEEEWDEGDGEEEIEEIEGKSIQKDMSMGEMSMDSPMSMAMGPTSFDELDQERLERERASALLDLSCDVRELVNNILGDPGMALEEKSAAIQGVGSDFSARSQEILAASNEDVIDAVEEKDLDLLSLQAMLAYSDRHSTIMDKLKAKVSYGSRQNMPDGNFAFVTTRNGKKVRKYLIHDKNHARVALGRAAQEIAAGGQAASDARAALPKIRAAAKKFGIEVSTKKERNAILIEKDTHNQWRWVGWVTNNFIDWDGDIFSEKAHQEYVEWLNKNWDAAPVFDTWHVPGTARVASVDFATYENGFLIESGPLTETEAAGLLKARQKVDLGMSHGTMVLERDPKDPRVVTKYRMYAASDLPLDNAANPFTDCEITLKEVGMDKLQYLSTIMGEEKARAFLEKTGLKQKELQQAGIESKEQKTAPATTPTGGTVSEPAGHPVISDELLQRIQKELDIEGLSATIAKLQEAAEKVPVLEEAVKELAATKEEALAEMLTPPVARFSWSQKARASQSTENVIGEDDKLKSKVPGVQEGYWLSEATGTVPVKEEAKV